MKVVKFSSVTDYVALLTNCLSVFLLDCELFHGVVIFLFSCLVTAFKSVNESIDKECDNRYSLSIRHCVLSMVNI